MLWGQKLGYSSLHCPGLAGAWSSATADKNTCFYWASKHLGGYWRFKWDNFEKMFWTLQANTHIVFSVSPLVRTFFIFRAGTGSFLQSGSFFWWLTLQDNPPSHITLRVGGYCRDLSDTPPIPTSVTFPLRSQSVALLTPGHCDQMWLNSGGDEFSCCCPDTPMSSPFFLASAHVLLTQ